VKGIFTLGYKRERKIMKKLLTTIALMLLIITGCGNGDFDKAMEEGKSALTNKEYTKALASFESALSEKKDDQEAKTLVEQTKAMIEAVKLKQETKLAEAMKSFEKIESTKNGSSTLVEQAKEERKATLALMEENYNKELVEGEELVSNKKYSEAKLILDKLVSEIKDNKDLEKYHTKALELIAKIDDAGKTAKNETVATGTKKKTGEEAKKQTAQNTKKETTGTKQKTNKEAKKETKKQDEFTGEKAIEYIDKHLNESGSVYTVGQGGAEVENGKKYYSVKAQNKFLMEQGGTGTIGRFKVFEDGTIVEE
jgi:hypothetical protein